MANKPTRPKARTNRARKGAAQSATLPAKRSLPWMWIGLSAVVVLAGGIAVLSAGDDEELTVGSTVPPGSTDETASTVAPGESLGEVWPVTYSGTPLEPLPSEGDDPAIGVTAPTMSGFSFDGTPVDIDPSKGPVMLVFLAHWCPHCNREVPELLDWKASGAVPPELQVIGVATAADPTAPNYPPSTWIKTVGWDWPVMADSEKQDASVAMGLSSYPFVVILDTDGKVLTRWAGEKGAEGIQELVEAALA
jgi:cytochrome c biogenesis protein CcmG, thiol:disulfide interchange protein DsbE